MKVKAYICPNCGDRVYSRALYDFRMCSCGSMAVDGGFDYIKISLSLELKFKDIMEEEIDLGDVTEKDLFEDYNSAKDYYGLEYGHNYLPILGLLKILGESE